MNAPLPTETSLHKCPDCRNEFVQPFKCTTCGAQKLYDVTVRSLYAQVEHLLGIVRELVECKDLKDRLDGWEAGSTQEMAAMAEEYDRRKPKAWGAARRLVQS
jgi:hypothetical protein